MARQHKSYIPIPDEIRQFGEVVISKPDVTRLEANPRELKSKHNMKDLALMLMRRHCAHPRFQIAFHELNLEEQLRSTVIIRTSDAQFTVHRMIIMAGSLYFNASLNGWGVESRDHTIDLEDVDTQMFHDYLRLAYVYFFERILCAGIPTGADWHSMDNSYCPKTWEESGVLVPSRDFAAYVGTTILADRFLHRSLLWWSRQLVTHHIELWKSAWSFLGHEGAEDPCCEKYDLHKSFVLHFLAAHEWLSQGVDHEILNRGALVFELANIIRYSEPLKQIVSSVAPEDSKVMDELRLIWDSLWLPLVPDRAPSYLKDKAVAMTKNTGQRLAARNNNYAHIGNTIAPNMREDGPWGIPEHWVSEIYRYVRDQIYGKDDET